MTDYNIYLYVATLREGKFQIYSNLFLVFSPIHQYSSANVHTLLPHPAALPTIQHILLYTLISALLHHILPYKHIITQRARRITVLRGHR